MLAECNISGAAHGSYQNDLLADILVYKGFDHGFNGFLGEVYLEGKYLND